MKVHILNHGAYVTSEGKVVETSSRPTTEPPGGDWKRYGWHDVLCAWMPVEALNAEFDAEI